MEFHWSGFAAAAVLPRGRSSLLSLLASLILVGCRFNSGSGAQGITYAGQPIAPLSASRIDPALVTLPDGRVLVTGGKANDSSIRYAAAATVEIYDPATEQWSRAASMGVPRWGHSATLLTDGRVLVVGGFAENDTTPTAELYDPATDSWRAAAAPANPYRFQTATLLSDGRVLVAGGSGPLTAMQFMPPSDGASDAAEIYDPATDRWTTVEKLPVARKEHVAAPLPDGRVLLLGGRMGGNKTDISGRNTQRAPLSTTAIFDPATNRWEAGPDAPIEGGTTLAILPNGQFLLANRTALALYDSATRTWRDLGAGHGLIVGGVLPAGQVLFAETDTSSRYRSPTGDLGLYDPATGEYRPIGQLRGVAWMGYATAQLADGSVLFARHDGEVELVAMQR